MGFKGKKRRNRAVSPAISTVIMTGVVVSLVTVALSFASNFLLIRLAESEFNSAKQFLNTIGLQLDDVAWIIGRTETARYSSRYGDVAFKQALNYTIYVNTTTQSNRKLYSNTTGIICYNMPVRHYSIGDGYFEHIYPSTNEGFLLSGTSAPVAKIFAVEKLPMADGSYIRTVVLPTIRMLNMTMGDADYIRLYLPMLSQGDSPKHSDSVTLTGTSISKIVETVTGIEIKVNFPLTDFDNTFFKFPQTEATITLTRETILELYVGDVDVGLGMHA
jgi:hypothetical protein